MRLLIFFTLALFSISAFAQNTELEKKLKAKKELEDGWTKGIVSTLTFSQTSLTNWAAGGQNALTFNGLLNIYANYKKGKATWDNTLDIGYGVVRQWNTDEYNKSKWIKSDDKIDFASKYGQQAFNNWYYAAMINFRTQMTKGFDLNNTLISDLFAPAYLLGAIGMDYKPNADFAMFIAPLTSKTTFVFNDSLATAGAFGVEAGEFDNNGDIKTLGSKVRNELGGYLKISFKKAIMENITLTTKADFFSNYLDNPGKIDVNWETLINLKVNKYITFNLTTQLLYDYDVKFEENGQETDKVQFKEVFGGGLTYKF